VTKQKVFISYSSRNDFEASLLQYAIETMLKAEGVDVWTYQRDQKRSEQEIARVIRKQIRESIAVVLLVSPDTMASGATQWMELAYADAFEVMTFILLQHLEFKDLKAQEKGVPPLLLSSQCTPAVEWAKVIEDIRSLVRNTTS
jgi:hypothetical protein